VGRHRHEWEDAFSDFEEGDLWGAPAADGSPIALLDRFLDRLIPAGVGHAEETALHPCGQRSQDRAAPARSDLETSKEPSRAGTDAGKPIRQSFVAGAEHVHHEAAGGGDHISEVGVTPAEERHPPRSAVGHHQ
jgi:hypothetical protein